MANGRQLADVNYTRFRAWVVLKKDADFRQMVSRGVLSRKEMAKECGFAKSVLDQNPRIKSDLRSLENDLRARGVLPTLDTKPREEAALPPMREAGQQRAMFNAERLKRLETENASLRSENACLRGENVELKRRLDQYAVLHEALVTTGRVPR
ncbi:VPA1267 family protein [Paraburkholderia sp. BCC1884]|uniref:VPA1267 family protein n=1 Tax=Paraburkholderia sp. BCC1884 TaxID=2562668 RepID=UPI00391F0399